MAKNEFWRHRDPRDRLVVADTPPAERARQTQNSSFPGRAHAPRGGGRAAARAVAEADAAGNKPHPHWSTDVVASVIATAAPPAPAGGGGAMLAGLEQKARPGGPGRARGKELITDKRR